MTAIGTIDELSSLISFIRDYEKSHRPPKLKKGETRRNDDYENPKLHEPQTKGVMIEPILFWMGWGLRDDPDSLWREYLQPNGQVDYVCRIGRRPCLTIECKKPGVNPRDRKVVTQACVYAFCANAPYAVLVDGLVWCIFDTYAKVSQTEKLVRKIDLRTCSTEEAFQFFKLISKQRALEGALKVPAMSVQTAAAKRRKKRPKNRRASLKSPGFQHHVRSVGLAFGGPLRPLGDRNTFMSPSGDKIRFCVSSSDQAQFNVPAEHLDEGLLYLAHSGYKHGWMIPTGSVGRYLADNGGAERKSWSPKVSSTDDGDALWISKNAPPLPLTAFRHTPGHA